MWNDINQHTFVGYMGFHIWVRPIRTPQDPIRKLFDKNAAKRNYVGIGRPLYRQSFRAADFVQKFSFSSMRLIKR